MGPVIEALVDTAQTTGRAQVRAGHKNSPMQDGEFNGRPSAFQGWGEGRSRGPKSEPADDFARLAALRAGNSVHTAQFVKDISATVWKSCRVLTGGDAEAREAFAETMAALSANRFARLAGYAGRGTLETFVALSVRDLLAERMLRLVQSDPQRGWVAFERLFNADIVKLIRKRLPHSEEARRDAYQDVCLALVDNDYRRLKNYNGSGSFAGFVLRAVDHLVIDRMRAAVPRRRLPTGVTRLSELDQEIFKLVCWQSASEHPDVLATHLCSRFGRMPDPAEIVAALSRVRPFVPSPTNLRLASIAMDKLEDVANPTELSAEDQLVQSEEEEQFAAALETLSEAIAALPGAERLYLTIVLGGTETPPSREIARLMQRPVEEIYKLKQRVLQHLRDTLSENSAIKTWRASV
jgi:RNA polymerase primary sigma factor